MHFTVAERVLSLLLIIIPLAGLMSRGWIAAFLLSTESINSPTLVTRWFYRGTLFGLYFTASFLVTPAVSSGLGIPLIRWVKNAPPLFFLAPLPIALLLLLLDGGFIRWADKIKVAARKRAAAYGRRVARRAES
ncbi:hypothetical protein [Lysobacter sp. HA18]